MLAETGLTGPVPVTAVGSHDTASAVVAVPAADRRLRVHLHCGTWSLAGLELDAPVLTEESRTANFTNELGLDGTVRYLRNIMGLWLLQECLRAWGGPDLARAAAAKRPGRRALRSVVDAGDAGLPPAGRMPERIAAACRRHRPAGAGRPERRRSAASWIAWRSPTAGARRRGAARRIARSTSCTSSAAARATRCCAS